MSIYFYYERFRKGVEVIWDIFLFSTLDMDAGIARRKKSKQISYHTRISCCHVIIWTYIYSVHLL